MGKFLCSFDIEGFACQGRGRSERGAENPLVPRLSSSFIIIIGMSGQSSIDCLPAVMNILPGLTHTKRIGSSPAFATATSKFSCIACGLVECRVVLSDIQTCDRSSHGESVTVRHVFLFRERAVWLRCLDRRVTKQLCLVLLVMLRTKERMGSGGPPGFNKGVKANLSSLTIAGKITR